MNKHLSTIILLVVFLAGLSLLLYPTVSDWWNSFHQSQAVANYAENVKEIDDDAYRKILEQAAAFNKELAGSGGNKFELSEAEMETYNSMLDITGTGMMGDIAIPVLQTTLPIYHGTSDAVLSVGVGHIEGSSLPVGGESTHCVLSGHRGLPSAKLFTNLDKLVVGDTFLLHILDETLTYEVDQIRIVEPYELNDLLIEEGKDYCTLVTCTPYGINTHRLLVRGHRIANQEEHTVRVSPDAFQIEPMIVAPFAAIPMLLILFVILLLQTRKKRPVRKSKVKR